MVAITRSMSKKKYQQHMREQSFLKEASSAPEIFEEKKRSFLKEASQIPLPTLISESKSSDDITCGLGRYPLCPEAESPTIIHTPSFTPAVSVNDFDLNVGMVMFASYISATTLLCVILRNVNIAARHTVRHFFFLVANYGKHLFEVLSSLTMISFAVLNAYWNALTWLAGFIYPFVVIGVAICIYLKWCINAFMNAFIEKWNEWAEEERRKKNLMEEKRRKQKLAEEQRRRRQRQEEEERRRQQQAQEARRRHMFEEWQRQQRRAREEQQWRQRRQQRSAQPVVDHYSILGVARNADANTIKSAYRRLALQHHPDKRGDPEMFRKVQEAWEELRDAEKRAAYDARCKYHPLYMF